MKVIVTRTLKNIVKIKYDNGVLKVVANCFLSQAKLKRIIAENSEWVASKKQAEKNNLNIVLKEEKTAAKSNNVLFDSVLDSEIIKRIFAGKTTMILGDIVNIEESMYSKTYLDGNTLYISEKVFKNKQDRIKAVKAYLRKVAALYLASEISEFGSNVSLCPSKIQFKELDGVWLNCADAGQKVLTIDYRVTQLPQELRRYIIAHAFAHFRNAVHDEKFENYLSNIMPRYKDTERKLEKYAFFKDV